MPDKASITVTSEQTGAWSDPEVVAQVASAGLLDVITAGRRTGRPFALRVSVAMEVSEDDDGAGEPTEAPAAPGGIEADPAGFGEGGRKAGPWRA